ncbi:serine hydrolase domain-containing protein [Gluconacetobacter takamatsuzukensis]|uniref:Beta-lactamase family protein n=1 Tax=Gluconacetobacter takamatsuzukensis TaxID=1286190 RepID=A0A7W4PQ63_9PROT|nr:beta-lactamase family protein [Gluconacetobacter takamatsuzukensis]
MRHSGRRTILRTMLAAGGAGLAAGCASPPPRRFAAVDRLVDRAIAAGQTPGAVVVVAHRGMVVHHRAYGQRALVPQAEPLDEATLFDMASLTKPVVTSVAVMQFFEAGAFRLDDPVCRYLPDFAHAGKAAITIRHLLTHYSGLPPDLDLSTPWQGKPEAVRRVMDTRPDHPAGERFVYSDINFITLGLLVEHLSHQSLAQYAHTNILSPLGMDHSRFLPPTSWYPTIAPTQFDEHGVMLRGIVHDPTARRMGGVAGHAGLFSNAADMTIYAQALLDRRAGRPSAFPLKPETLLLMTTPQQPLGKDDLRGLGWDIRTHYSSPRGDIFPVGSFGHTGFTGTSLWMDQDSDSFVLILTNRVHPSGGHSIVRLRHDVATEAARALQAP